MSEDFGLWIATGNKKDYPQEIVNLHINGQLSTILSTKRGAAMGEIVGKKLKISRYFLLDFRKNFMLKYVST